MQAFKYFPLLFVQGITIKDGINIPILHQEILRTLDWAPSVPEAGTLKSLRINNEAGFRGFRRMIRDSGLSGLRRSIRKMPVTEDKYTKKATANFENREKNNFEEHRLFSSIFMRV